MPARTRRLLRSSRICSGWARTSRPHPSPPPPNNQPNIMEEKIICSMNGVGIYGVISIAICAAFFTGTFLWAAGLKKNYLNHMQDLPLDGGEKDSTDKN